MSTHPYRQWHSPKPSKVELGQSTSWWILPELVNDRAAFMAKAQAESVVMKARQSGIVLNELITI